MLPFITFNIYSRAVNYSGLCFAELFDLRPLPLRLLQLTCHSSFTNIASTCSRSVSMLTTMITAAPMILQLFKTLTTDS